LEDLLQARFVGRHAGARLGVEDEDRERVLREHAGQLVGPAVAALEGEGLEEDPLGRLSRRTAEQTGEAQQEQREGASRHRKLRIKPRVAPTLDGRFRPKPSRGGSMKADPWTRQESARRELAARESRRRSLAVSGTTRSSIRASPSWV